MGKRGKNVRELVELSINNHIVGLVHKYHTINEIYKSTPNERV